MHAGHALIATLAGVVGDAHVLTDADLRASYETDWTRRWSGEALAVVRPASTAEVAQVVAACHAAGVAVIPQGGNTGLVGGSVPRASSAVPQVVVSLLRLREIEAPDDGGNEVTVGAGATLAAVQEAVRPRGLDVGVDLGARDSATIGGMVATNAGGIQAFRHGPMRAQLVGIEAVLADGSVVRRLPGMLKDNTGYHLPSLFAGSEGTLGIVTRLRVRLVRRLPRRAVALLAVSDADEAASAFGALRARLPGLLAGELFFDDGMRLVLRHSGGQPPFGEPHPAYLLAEVEGTDDPTDELAGAVAALPTVRDAVLAADAPGRERLWALRERHTESVNAAGVPHKLDVAVPIGRLGAYVGDVRAAIGAVAPDARTFLYGHVGDGNLHVNVLGPPPEDEAIDDAVLGLAIEHGGTVSAEHGIGIAKVGWLAVDRGASDMSAMRAIKRALDPDGRMNPGVLFDPDLAP
jgi:FAD/FMN-containing dehydrogenase